MRGSLLILLALMMSVSIAAAAEYQISADEWARPRSGEMLLQLPGLQQLFRDHRALAQPQVEIRYPGGERGSLWAAELRDWLVALGIPSYGISLVAGQATGDHVTLVLRSLDRE